MAGRERAPDPVDDATTVVEPKAARPTLSDSGRTLGPNTSLSALSIGEVIGEGGMGVVREAIQLSLDRRVAVKAPLEGASEGDADRMLREAWVTGFLEHPGVVPIYDIAKGPHGPVVVMRRIEGETWHDCLGDTTWARAAGARDLLEQNLRVFVRVCEIVEFAHAKGVIHRDVKPGNVMIGAFGEVYLLDWGLALALRGEAERHLPRSADTREIAGTMAYAAPEMVDLVDAPLSERTDIYLLGSVLFELTTGARPHAKSTDAGRIASIDTTPPPIPDGVSPQLAASVRRAMQRLPNDRHSTVAQLRLEVLAYLRSRDASILIERELARDPRRALALLEDDSDGVSPELAARVREAANVQLGEDARLAQLARDHDDSIGRRTRRILIFVLGGSWATSLPVAERFGPVTHTRFALGGLLQLVALGVACLVAPEVTKSLYNRRIVGALAVAFATQAALFASIGVLGGTVALARTLQIGMWAMGSAILSVTHERRFAPMAVGSAIAFGVAVAVPSLRSYAAGVAALCITFNMMLVGRSPAPRA